jgi:hypothetical protein
MLGGVQPKRCLSRKVIDPRNQYDDIHSDSDSRKKTTAKPVTEVSEDEDDDLSFLPVKSIDDFKKFERILKQNEDIFRKLVCFILSIS